MLLACIRASSSRDHSKVQVHIHNFIHVLVWPQNLIEFYQE